VTFFLLPLPLPFLLARYLIYPNKANIAPDPHWQGRGRRPWQYAAQNNKTRISGRPREVILSYPCLPHGLKMRILLLLVLAYERGPLLGYSHQELKGRRRKKKKPDVPLPTYLFFFKFLRFSGLLENIFVVFLGFSCRETATNARKQIDGKIRQKKTIRPKVFDMDFPLKALMLFLNSPC
jgi:hypothetical protein